MGQHGRVAVVVAFALGAPMAAGILVHSRSNYRGLPDDLATNRPWTNLVNPRNSELTLVRGGDLDEGKKKV